MKIVYLTSGPRGAGKSTYVKEAKSRSPDIQVISRDDLLIELFGDVVLDTYSGGHSYAIKIMIESVNECLKVNENVRMILDCWNGYSSERCTLIRKLREAGADFVFCLFFVLPVNVNIDYFFKKDDIAGNYEPQIRWNYKLFYRESRNIESDGFDKVIRIDPRQMLLPQISTF